jgi:tRNA threonylcarbamoyladenosine biosynthesis protein TsaE
MSESRRAEMRGSSRVLIAARGPADVRWLETLILGADGTEYSGQPLLDTRISSSPEQTESVGGELAGTLVPGDVVLVRGELGAGKTTFVRGAARALGVTAPVTSPTFTIGQRYPGPVQVAHVDLFRVENLESEDPDLLADYLRADTIAFVEWSSRGELAIAALGRIAARVAIEHAGGDNRTVRIERW